MKNLINSLIVLSWFFLILWACVGINNLVSYLIYFWVVIILSGVGWVWDKVSTHKNT